MMITTLSTFLAGALCFGFLVAGLFFLKYWRSSRDTLFLLFALAFVLMGIERGIVNLAFGDETVVPHVYVFRLVAFCLLISGIIAKNRKR
ncbi:MAG TPA: DUF5985 family protein [Verrucomicrobiae bacterium]|nr:DUF5985 family protein [Verrucomicrobiae bacterium]